MEHEIPTSILEVHQETLKELILARDPDATFVLKVQPPVPEPEEPEIGK